ncbi:hypothetical protein E0Z10_g3522 [Xylaria hypoxylon]|uniref:Protein kinase domain-containing protein n=1 Tax=Xylaria hypoxylon TaxID=37992 RepID=A0A4Z0Z747_9PEZI|nr:hypothetical protein E0Z10_g3522 [Xylaria hypoxylon]
MSDPFSSPPGGGRGGRGAFTPSPPPRGGGRGTAPWASGGRGSPDPFGGLPPAPRQFNPFVRRPACRGGRGGRGLFGQFGARTTASLDDPFGGSSVMGGPERQDWLQQARESFSDEARFTVEKASVTTSGMLLRVVEMLDAGRAPRRFAVKASFPEVAGMVARERDWTHRVRFARHIVKWLALTPDPMTPGPGNAGFRRPYFFLEYLENVIRACVGMAWPPDGPDVVLEAPTPPEPLTLAHMDMHNNNVMFGVLDEKEVEHIIVPIAKLIDLGEVQERPTGEPRFPPNPSAMENYDNVLSLATYRPNTGRRNQGIDKNIFDVGVLMAGLIANMPGFGDTCRRNMINRNIHPHLDEDLRVLIQRCLAVDPENRPRLEELTELASQANSPFFRDWKYYKKDEALAEMGAVNAAEELETDGVLHAIVQMFILNADLDPSSRI